MTDRKPVSVSAEGDRSESLVNLLALARNAPIDLNIEITPKELDEIDELRRIVSETTAPEFRYRSTT
jgi:hypothetical protein